MKVSAKDDYLVVELEFDTTLLEEKINLLSELKSSFLEYIVHGVNRDLSSFSFDCIIENNNIVTSHFVTTVSASEAKKLVCVLDLNIINFIREWIIAMRASNKH